MHIASRRVGTSEGQFHAIIHERSRRGMPSVSLRLSTSAPHHALLGTGALRTALPVPSSSSQGQCHAIALRAATEHEARTLGPSPPPSNNAMVPMPHRINAMCCRIAVNNAMVPMPHRINAMCCRIAVNNAMVPMPHRINAMCCRIAVHPRVHIPFYRIFRSARCASVHANARARSLSSLSLALSPRARRRLMSPQAHLSFRTGGVPTARSTGSKSTC